jgi:hypothetical protein
MLVERGVTYRPSMRALCSWLVCVAFGVAVAGCGGSGDERPELAAAEQATPTVETSEPEAARSAAPNSVPSQVRSVPLPPSQQREVGKQAAGTAGAVRRWDAALAACVGPSGDGDDADATCTHAAWEQLVDQVEIEMYYLLEHLRAMPRGYCHEALGAENDILRGFWHGAAPLDLAWLDEQQRPPSRFDLETAVDLVRPVPGRIRGAVTTVCAP